MRGPGEHLEPLFRFRATCDQLIDLGHQETPNSRLSCRKRAPDKVQQVGGLELDGEADMSVAESIPEDLFRHDDPTEKLGPARNAGSLAADRLPKDVPSVHLHYISWVWAQGNVDDEVMILRRRPCLFDLIHVVATGTSRQILNFCIKDRVQSLEVGFSCGEVTTT